MRKSGRPGSAERRGVRVRRSSDSKGRERGSVRLRARAQGYFIRNSETLRADRQRFILDPDPGPDTHARAEDKFAYRPHADTKKMVDILVPTSGAGVRTGATTATVKTVVTESGPQQVIVIPQSLFQQANVGSAIQKQQQKPVIRISPATTSPSLTARAALKRSIKVSYIQWHG